MRAFIAIEMSKEIKDYLYGLQKKFQAQLRKENIKINWIAKKNLHLTLKFLGEVNEETIDIVRKRLKMIEFNELGLELDNLGFFPGEDYIRVVYAGLQPEEKVIELQQRIDMELLDIFTKEQDFHGHVTIARVKFVKDKIKLRELMKEKIEKKKMTIKNFQLMKSELSKDGPRYFVLEKFKCLEEKN